MTFPALMQVGQRSLRLICVFLPWLLFDVRRPQAFHGPAFEPRSLDLGSGGSSPRAPWGSVGVGHLSCVTPSLVFVTGGAKLTTLASMARVTHFMSSLMGMFGQNPILFA